MKRYNIHAALLIEDYNEINCENTPHTHNYFELVFIETGSGKHCINSIDVPYQSGSVFLLGPDDEHFFQPHEQSNFTHFKFTELLFMGQSILPDRKHWLERIHPILTAPNLLPGDCLLHEDDRKLVWDIKDVARREFKNEKEFFLSILTNNVTTILSIVARNIIEKYNINQTAVPTIYINKSDQILAYIRQHIYEADLLSIEHLAAHFNMAENYISSFFKKETGESIKQYIINYRLYLLKYRLRHTSLSISELAHQLDFTDESHLTKAFKKKFGITPKDYREQHATLLK